MSDHEGTPPTNANTNTPNTPEGANQTGSFEHHEAHFLAHRRHGELHQLPPDTPLDWNHPNVSAVLGSDVSFEGSAPATADDLSSNPGEGTVLPFRRPGAVTQPETPQMPPDNQPPAGR